MAQFRSLSNTDKEYPCTSCGSKQVSIIREDPNGHNPRLKCGGCGFMFNGADSQAAAEAGEIKPSSAEALASATEPEVETITTPIHPYERPLPDRSKPLEVTKEQGFVYECAPQRPSHVFLRKDRKGYQFVSKRDFKKTVIEWSRGDSFDVYELHTVKVNVKVDVS